MKPLFKLFALAGIAFLALQCDLGNENAPADDEQQTVTLTIMAAEHTEAGAEGKATISAVTGSVMWEEGDSIAINGINYPVIPDATDATIATVEDVTMADEYFAIFPADAWIEPTDGEYVFDIPCHQAATSHSESNIFADYNIMTGYCTGGSLQLYNLLSYIRLSIVGTNSVRCVSIIPYNYVAPVGYYRISLDAMRKSSYPDTYTVGTGTAMASVIGTVSLNASAPTYFDVAVVPQRYENGFYAYITDEDGYVCIQRYSNDITFSRSTVTPMETLTFTQAEPPTVEIISTTETSISFEVKGLATLPLNAFVTTKALWDSTPASQRESTFRLYYGGGYVDPDTGVFSDTQKDACIGAETIPIEPGTEYVVVAAYTDWTNGMAILQAGTAAATTTSPSTPAGGLTTEDFTIVDEVTWN